jgi:hypothetical protein
MVALRTLPNPASAYTRREQRISMCDIQPVRQARRTRTPPRSSEDKTSAGRPRGIGALVCASVGPWLEFQFAVNETRRRGAFKGGLLGSVWYRLVGIAAARGLIALRAPSRSSEAPHRKRQAPRRGAEAAARGCTAASPTASNRRPRPRSRDLRSFCVVARRFRGQPELGLNRLEMVAPSPHIGRLSLFRRRIEKNVCSRRQSGVQRDNMIR